MRIVIDVNVWISGLLWGGNPKEILNLAKNGKVIIFVSKSILRELEEVLDRVKFQTRMRSLGVTKEDLINLVHQLSETHISVLVDAPQLRDPDDAEILGTAIAVRASVIISGDLDLQVLEKFTGIPILSPTDFLVGWQNF